MDIRKTPGTQLMHEAQWRKHLHATRRRSAAAPAARQLGALSARDDRPRSAHPDGRAGHYQFEAIHPFTDGNGRTGRVINILVLIQEQLLALPVLYLSRYIIANKADYYRLLQDVTRLQSPRGWEAWVLYMLRAVEDTARWTTQKIRRHPHPRRAHHRIRAREIAQDLQPRTR